MTDPPVIVLGKGELRRRETFGPRTVNRGAVLVDCAWDGGIFESGALVGGLFRSGKFQGGLFWGGSWLGGTWTGGDWESGFGPDGQYRPRTVHP
jgi:hypothetical protein